LSGALGTLLAGRNDTPLRQLQARIDQFNDLQGDLRVLMVGENRPNDTINYVSPTFGGFTFRHAAVFDGQNTLLDRFTKATSTSLSYTAGRFYVGVALDRDVISLEDDRNDDVRLAGQYNEGNLQLGILYESSVNRANNRGREDGLLISASLTRGRFVYKAQTGTSEQRRPSPDFAGRGLRVESRFQMVHLLHGNTRRQPQPALRSVGCGNGYSFLR